MEITIGSDMLLPNRRQAIIWTNDQYEASKGL